MSPTDAAGSPLFTPGSLARAAFRGVLVGLATMVCVSAFFVATGELTLNPWILFGVTFLPGLAAAPFALVERAAAARPPRVRRDVAFALAAWGVGFVGVSLALLEVVYVVRIQDHGSSVDPAAAGRFLAWFFGRLKGRDLLFLAALAAPAAPTLVARVRGVRRWRRVLLVPFANALLAAAPATPSLLGGYTALVVACVVASASLLPIVLEAADGIERRFFPSPR